MSLKKIINISFLSLIITLFLVICLIPTANKVVSHADSRTLDSEEINTVEITDTSTYGVFTSLSISLDGDNGEVWAIAKNKITIFPSTVMVIVELYSSFTYQESHLNMTLEAKNNIADLDMGNTLEARANTNGEQKYWKARMYYKVDNKDWVEQSTETILLDKNGVLVM